MSNEQTTTPRHSGGRASELITEHCCAELCALIEEHGGREVFAIGTCDAAGLIDQLDPVAFGTWDCVPAPGQQARAGQVLIHNHPSGGVAPSDADVAVASDYGRAGVGFYIVDNEVREVGVVVKPFREQKIAPIDADAMLAGFAQGGTLAQQMPGYEVRPQQLEMLGTVVRAFNGERIAVVEAGTGTGKSFAYLAPSIAWATANKQRVVISTNTINLQEQLLKKDLPALGDRMGLKFKAVLVKGRSNYISLRRLRQAAASPELFASGRTTELRQLEAWSAKTPDGSKSDLAFKASDDVWEAVMSDKDDCMRARCPHFNECFFYRSRREASAADVIVANHHLVMADIALKKDLKGNDFMAILPPFDHVVFDEAHHIEEVATEYFSSETSHLGIRRQLLKLASGRGEARGALPRMVQAVLGVDAAGLYPATRQVLEALRDTLPMRLHEAEQIVDNNFDALFYKTLSHYNQSNLGAREQKELRVTANVLNTPFWNDVRLLLQESAAGLKNLVAPIRKTLQLLKFYPEEIVEELAGARLGVSAVETKVSEHMAAIEFFLKAGEEDYCRWFGVRYFRERPLLRICTAPLDMAPLLRTALFARKKAVVLTSATLTVDRKFDFLAKQLGLVGDSEAPGGAGGQGAAPATDGPDGAVAREDVSLRTDYLLLGTPFDYENNCLIGVALDVAAPNSGNFESSMQSVVFETLRITHGHALVLFTSYSSLEKLYLSLRGPLAELGITAMRQGEMQRHQLLDVFRSTPNSALFATSSFWEGIDVQGSALECVVLTRLPFRVPTTPILEARTERIDRKGGNSFTELTIPLAVIRFKQGFGRLIRSRTDRGIVLVLDNRIATKYYGKMFLRSLPPARVLQGTTPELLGAFREFLAQ